MKQESVLCLINPTYMVKVGVECYNFGIKVHFYLGSMYPFILDMVNVISYNKYGVSIIQSSGFVTTTAWLICPVSGELLQCAVVGVLCPVFLY